MVRVKCFAQEHNTMTPESSAITITRPRLPLGLQYESLKRRELGRKEKARKEQLTCNLKRQIPHNDRNHRNLTTRLTVLEDVLLCLKE